LLAARWEGLGWWGLRRRPTRGFASRPPGSKHRNTNDLARLYRPRRCSRSSRTPLERCRSNLLTSANGPDRWYFSGSYGEAKKFRSPRRQRRHLPRDPRPPPHRPRRSRRLARPTPPLAPERLDRNRPIPLPPPKTALRPGRTRDRHRPRARRPPRPRSRRGTIRAAHPTPHPGHQPPRTRLRPAHHRQRPRTLLHRGHRPLHQLSGIASDARKTAGRLLRAVRQCWRLVVSTRRLTWAA
jgi:hypothetical protein